MLIQLDDNKHNWGRNSHSASSYASRFPLVFFQVALFFVKIYDINKQTNKQTKQQTNKQEV